VLQDDEIRVTPIFILCEEYSGYSRASESTEFVAF